jgi:hypothetical protein
MNSITYLCMSSTHLYVDEFFSHVVEKASNLKKMGVKVSESEIAQCALAGLSSEFVWIQNMCRVPDATVNFDVIEKMALDYAADKGLLRKSKPKQHEKNKPNEDRGKGVLNVVQKKRYCYKFNSDAGCQRSKCSFLHEKIPKSNTDKVFTCYTCGKKGHIAKNCRSKKDKKENKSGKDEKKEENSGESDSPGPVAFSFSSKVPSGNWFF